MKPIPLAAYGPNFIPPVTGINGSLAPVANNYDESNNFQNRGRANSVKRRRTDDELDRVYDLSMDFPPLQMPQKPGMDLEKVKGLVVAAGAAAEEIRPMLEDPNIDPKMAAFAKLNFAVLDALSAVVDSGIIPLATGAGVASRKGNGAGSGHFAGAGAGAGAGKAPATAPKPTPAPGLKELKEGLEKADKESILFDANLGNVTLANRQALATAFSVGLRNAAVEKAKADGKDPTEAVRIMDDVLSCVNDMDFVGASSKKFISKNVNDDKNNTFCTMPIRFKFDDRSTRIHFESSIKSICGLRAAISLPRAIREEQKAFQQAVKSKYPDEIVTIRVDTRNQLLQAYRKLHGQKEWIKCNEYLELLPGTLLPGYNPRQNFVLEPEELVAVPALEQAQGGAQS
jgi:hypothetical protein